MRSIDRAVAVAALVAAGAVLAGCGQQGSATSGALVSDGSERGNTPKETALLAPADLPPGLQRAAVDAQALMKKLNAAGGVRSDPPECGQVQRAVFKTNDMQGVALVAAGKSASGPGSVSETLVTKPADFNLDEVRAVVHKCARSTVSVGKLRATNRLTETTLSGIKTDGLIALHQETTTEGERGNTMQGNDFAVIVVGDRVLMLAVSGQPGTTLAEVAPKAVQRARQS